MSEMAREFANKLDDLYSKPTLHKTIVAAIETRAALSSAPVAQWEG